MTIMAAGRALENVVPVSKNAASPVTKTWPLALVLVGFPLMWIMGLSVLVLHIATAIMVWQLYRKGRVTVPRGFSLWVGFLVIVAISGVTLYADAPSAETGGSFTRILSWVIFSSYYVCATVVFLWIGNLDERELPTLTVIRMAGFLYVFAIVAGFLGTYMAKIGLDFPSVFEAVLKAAGLAGLANHPFVRDLVHPNLAQNMTLGTNGPAVFRAAAPFSYTNSWGGNTAILLPFFVYGYIVRGAGMVRILSIVFLVASMGVAVMSLNRGMWLGIAFMVGLLTLRLTLQGKFIAIVIVAFGIAGVAASLFIPPIRDTVESRLANGHSDARRGDLATLSLESALRSPLIGFGSTRAVAGNFRSVAGGSTEDCSHCGVPPLGTHGQLYRVVFSQGFLGGFLFFGFLIYRLVHHGRSRDPVAMLAWLLIWVSLLFSFFYNLLPHALYYVMIAMALAWRRDRAIQLREAMLIAERPGAKEVQLPAAGTS